MSVDSRQARVNRQLDGLLKPFRHLLRGGNPGWPWRETDPQRWQTALHAIERAVRNILNGDHPHPFLDGNAQDIGVAAFTCGMGPILGYWASENVLETEPAIRAILDLHYSHNRERMNRLAEHARAPVEAFAAQGIEVTVLKGMHTAFGFFPTPGCRPMSDIDLLVAPSDAQAASLALQSLGYHAAEQHYGQRSFRMTSLLMEPANLSFLHCDDPWSIDLHRSLNARYSPGAPMIRMDCVVWQAKAPAWPLSRKASVLTGEELVVQLACHASSGLASLSLLRLTELVFVIRKLESESGLCWERVTESVARSGVPGSIYPALRMVSRLVPGTIPGSVLRALERECPPAVRNVMARLDPATCQRVIRFSFTERFMWTRTMRGWVREIFLSVFPQASIGQMLRIYVRRILILTRGQLSS